MLDKKKLKEKLEKERDDIMVQLKELGKLDPETGDWEAVPDEKDYSETDQNDMADRFEEFEAKSANLDVLETRLRNVLFALKNINKSSFGKCIISGEDIEEDRLMANPAAKTCKKHINEE